MVPPPNGVVSVWGNSGAGASEFLHLDPAVDGLVGGGVGEGELVGAGGEDDGVVVDLESGGSPGDLVEVGFQGQPVGGSGKFGVEEVGCVGEGREGLEGEAAEGFESGEGKGVGLGVVG